MRKNILLFTILILIFIILFMIIYIFNIFIDDYEELKKISEIYEIIDHSMSKKYIDWKLLLSPKIEINEYKFLKGKDYTVQSKYEIITDSDIQLISASEDWNEDKLKVLYSEFLKNKHGNEINYLDSIFLIPDDSWSRKDAVGFYAGDNIQYNLELSLTNYVSAPFRLKKSQSKSQIFVNTGIDRNEVDDILRTLAHEYGHHYTDYYIDFDKYKSVRKLENEPRVKDYDWDHMWYIDEIAAEDYVQLMGYYKKEVKTYYDAEQRLKRYVEKGIEINNDFTKEVINFYPQENFYIPLADEVIGLEDYFLSFIGEYSDEKNNHNSRKPITISSKKIGKGKWEITWTPSEEDDSDILYTLVAYGKSPEAIKTVNGNSDLKAILLNGSIDYKNYTYTVTFPTNIVDLKVYALYPDGFMASSEIYELDISK